MISSWLSDTVFRRLFLNAGRLISGNALAALVGLANMALTTRILGLETFGIFVLMMAYLTVFGRIFNAQSWKFIIKYGADALHDADSARLGMLIKFGMILDGIGALGGVLCGVLLAPIAGRYLDFTQDQIFYLMAFNLVSLTAICGAATGVLRLYDRFFILSLQPLVPSLAVFSMLVPASLAGAGLSDILIIYAAGILAGNLYVLANGLKVLHEEGQAGFWQQEFSGALKGNQGLSGFIIHTYAESLVKTVRQLDVFAVKVVLSAEAVGLYRIARRLAETLNKGIDPFFTAIYPELARFHAQKNRAGFSRLMRQSSCLVGGVSLLALAAFMAAGPWFVPFAFGVGTEEIYGLTGICLVALVIWAAIQPLLPALHAMGAVRPLYYSHLLAALLYMVSLYYMLHWMGSVGAALSFVLFHAVQAAGAIMIYYYERKKAWAV